MLLAGAVGAQTPTLAGCSVFPSDNVWNTPVDKLPVHPDSAAYVATIGTTSPLHPDFGHAANNGIPYNVVSVTKPNVPVTFTYSGESDPGPYPIPPNPVIEGGDSHMLLIDTANCIDYELFGAKQAANGAWTAGSGAIFSLKSNNLRPAGWTSADAAGLPVFPGLVRYDEAVSGVINHAIRFTAPLTADSYVWPARHEASAHSGPQYPPMGTRFRLKANFDVSGYSTIDQAILNAIKKYGIILADNGGPWFITGTPDARWNDDDLHLLTYVTGADLEAVDESSLMVNPNSAEAKEAASTKPASGLVVNKWVRLVSKSSGKCLESTAYWLGAALDQRTCSGAAAQLFELTAVSGGYKVTVQSSGMQWDVAGGPAATADGTAVVQYPFWGGTNEIWAVTAAAAPGFYTFHPVSSGKCLDISGLSNADGAAIVEWTCTGADNQAWEFR